jgi:SAM-dependent methyltransferase
VSSPGNRRFADDRRGAPRVARRGDPYAHHVRELTAGIARLAGSLRAPSACAVLDFGCAEKPYRHLFPQAARYVGADLPGNPDADVEIQPDGGLPLDDEGFDVVLSTQVLEHVEDPARHLAESFRVLRPGGELLLTTHGVFVYHPDPVDLWRWTGEGLRRTVEDAGFRVERLEGIIGLAATGVQLVQDAAWGRISSERLRRAVASVGQGIAAWADRRESEDSRRLNASVYGVVATRPAPDAS